jgi:mycothiol synthase
MITYAWRLSFGPQEERELREMLGAAAEQDAEPGFPAVSLDQPYGDDASHLVVRLLPDGRAGRAGSSPVAAYLRVEPGPGAGAATVRYVVRPEFRSRGISTLLLETLGLDLHGEGGWAGTGASAIRVWARGDHPAAQRMASRFGRSGVRPGRRQWQLLAPLSGLPDNGPGPRPPAGAAEEAAAAALWQQPGGPPDDAGVLIDGQDPAGAAWFDAHPGGPAGYGATGRIIAVTAAPGRPEIRAGLVAAAMARLRDHGLRAAAITIDAEDRALARDCRLLGFQHDRTDTEYTVGVTGGAGPPTPPRG